MPEGICACGCGKPTKIAKRSDKRWGHVLGNPVKYVKGHTHKTVYAFVLQDRGYKTPCWIWKRHINHGGYALVGAESTLKKAVPQGGRYAHRVYYEFIIGPVPEGLELDHLCRVRCCVNPNHLEPVTKKENAQRGLNTKLTQAQIQEMFALKLGGMKVRLIAERYGIHKVYLERLCQRNKIWVTK